MAYEIFLSHKNYKIIIINYKIIITNYKITIINYKIIIINYRIIIIQNYKKNPKIYLFRLFW